MNAQNLPTELMSNRPRHPVAQIYLDFVKQLRATYLAVLNRERQREEDEITRLQNSMAVLDELMVKYSAYAERRGK
jgi:hypothetical protein